MPRVIILKVKVDKAKVVEGDLAGKGVRTVVHLVAEITQSLGDTGAPGRLLGAAPDIHGPDRCLVREPARLADARIVSDSNQLGVNASDRQPRACARVLETVNVGRAVSENTQSVCDLADAPFGGDGGRDEVATR